MSANFLPRRSNSRRRKKRRGRNTVFNNGESSGSRKWRGHPGIVLPGGGQSVQNPAGGGKTSRRSEK